MSDTFKKDVSNKHKEMLAILETINIDDLRSEGLSLSFGGKTFKFADVELVDNGEELEKIRQDFKDKLNDQQSRIRDKINSKINQLLVIHQNKQQELERKEKELRKKYSEAAMMPDITKTHAVKGLSVIKGNNNDELIWIYKAVYNPKFIIIPDSRKKHRKAIPKNLVDRMKKSFFIFVKTKGNQVLSVLTKYIQRGSFVNFPHYHQTGTSDCWGSWKHAKSWKTPTDILGIAKDAEAVLETINQGSLASRGPSGLPRSSTIVKAVEDLDDVNVNPTTVRSSNTDDDIWEAI